MKTEQFQVLLDELGGLTPIQRTALMVLNSTEFSFSSPPKALVASLVVRRANVAASSKRQAHRQMTTT